MSSAFKSSSPNVEENTIPARRVLQRYGKSFYFASFVLDRATAERCARLYAFCRYIDDIADETEDPCVAREQLGNLIEMLAAGCSSDPYVADFLDLAASNGMPVEPAIDLAKGVLCDLSDVRMKDLAELHVYCYRVAGTVGLMMCGVLGVHDPRAYPFAIDLGIAMQMTNIARDVCEDAESGRRYLPATILGNVSPAELIHPTVELQPQLASAIEVLLQEAEAYYQSGQAGLVFLPSRSRLGIRIAARVYRQIGVRLRKNNFAVWRGRAIVALWEKLAVSAIAIKEHFASTPQASKRPLHRHELHRSLQGLTGVSQVQTSP